MDYSKGQTMTLSGCLAREKDVPGMAPNVAERAGMGEDYILTNVSMAASSTSSSTSTTGSTGSTGTTSSTGTSGSTMSGTQTGQSASAMSGKMYKIEGLDDSRLQPFVGQRVEVTGKMKAGASHGTTGSTTGTTGSTTGSTTGQASPTAATSSAGSNDVPEFEATSIRKASTGGTCPAPASR
jgi:hypothetical protein